MLHLLNTSEVATQLGVSRVRVVQLASDRADFPPPYAYTCLGTRRLRLWRESDIATWEATADRRPGNRHLT